MEVVLSVHGLAKYYGSVCAVEDVGFEVLQGQVCGILGPNGSGKTTTLSVIMGTVSPQKGIFRWAITAGDVKNPNLKIGALIESPNFYPYLSLVENLKIHTVIKSVPYDDIGRVLKITGLYERRHSKFQTLSLGMKQRLGIAVTLLGDPEVLVLDEPANGLDPEGIADIRKIIRLEAEKGKTILMASHILDEVEKVCSHVVVLKNGKVIGNGSVGELLTRNEHIIVSCDNPEKLITLAEQDKRIKKISRENNDIVLHVDEGIGTAEVNRLAFSNGIVLTRLTRRRPTLESQFLELVKD